MIPMLLSEVVTAVGGRYVGEASLLDAPVQDVCIDSRAVAPGALYVPVHGARFDGHDFIPAARTQGALCVLTARGEADGAPAILVPDTLAALHLLAVHYRAKFPIPLVGVTGSSGKTSIKEMVASVLSGRFNVLKSQGNMNNQTGVPLMLFRLDQTHEAAVIEMGTNHFGEIRALSKITRPDVCLLSNIGVAHIEFFGSREGILAGKAEMLEYMNPNGTVIVNGDDDMLVRIPDAFRFGLSEGCALRAVDLADLGLDGTAFTVTYNGARMRMTVPAPGRHMVYNALAAISAGLALGMDLAQLKAGVEAFIAPAGRMDIRRTGRLTVLDDSYNANPASVMAAVDVLERVPGRRVCVLGDMLELGRDSDEFHEVVGMYAAMHGADLVVCVGPNSEQTFMGAHALAPSRARYFETQETLLRILPLLLREGDTVLVKASRGMHLEETVDMLLGF